jgi:hypothetical protein
MRKTTIIAAAVFLSFIAVAGQSRVEGAEWVPIAKGEMGTYAYDHESVKKESGDLVQVWAKVAYSEQGKKDVIGYQKKAGFNMTGWEDLSSESMLWTIDCKEKKMRYSTIIFHDSKGEMLDQENPASPEWEPIKQGSTGSALYNVVCAKEEKQQ